MEQKRYNAPELLAPVGDMERLISAVRYGADAAYLAGTSFGMRSAPSNFTNEEHEEAVKFSRITQNLPRCRRFSSFARQSV